MRELFLSLCFVIFMWLSPSYNSVPEILSFYSGLFLSTICVASISNEFQINAGVESCTSWTEPAKAYVWYASVCPTNPFGDHNP